MDNNNPVYKSPYPSEVTYRSDKNFIVRLVALVVKSMEDAGYNTRDEQFSKAMENFGNAEDYLFKSKVNDGRAESISFTEWVALKEGLWFNVEYLYWELPDHDIYNWYRKHGQGFPRDRFRFTTEKLYNIFKTQTPK